MQLYSTQSVYWIAKLYFIMFQEILVYIILASVLVYSIVAIYKKLKSKPKSACEDCAGCGLKEEMIKKGKTDTHNCGYQPLKTEKD